MGIRWDAVVDPAAAAEAGCAPPPAARSISLADADRVLVDVRLFGALAYLTSERSLRLELPAHSTVGDVLVRLGERFGASFLALLVDEAGTKRRHCRLFVGGYAVESTDAPLPATADPSEIEIILLVAPEGG
jgi:hypothetical protein